MRFLSFFVLFCFLLVSCQDIQRSEKPKDLIPEEKMVDILTEFALLQGARTYSRGDLESRGLKPEEYLWERFDIDSSQYARSSTYYAENYQVYQRIYQKVKDSLEGLKEKFDSLRLEQAVERDSLRERQRRGSPGGTLQTIDTLEPDTTGSLMPEGISREAAIEENPF